MDECIPNKVVTIRPNDKPSFTSKVRKLYRECQHLHKKKLRTKNPLDIDRYRAKRKEAKDAFRLAKSQHFKNISKHLLDPETSSKSFWKLVKGVYGIKQSVGIPPLVENGELITNDSTKASILNNYFTSKTIPPTSNTPLPPFTYRTDARLSTINITPQMVTDILTNLNTGKACGPDGINNKILKECSYSLSLPLSFIFQKSIDLGYFPDTWKEAMVSAILKKNDRQDKTNYRPISLLTCMSKVFERIVFNHLYHFLITNNLLNSHNSGFRKNDSTINRLISLLHSVHTGLDERENIILVLLDISKAFDKVWHPGLLFKLKQLCQNLLDWFESYLTNRRQKTVVGGKSSSTSFIQAGVPQG